MKNIVVLSGAGVSAESGVKTFRDAGGLWEGFDVMDVASIDGWIKDKSLVLDFYNQRRRQLFTVEPNIAHYEIAKLEESHQVTVVTQNVDDLHERAGSSKVIHLHGELLKVRGVNSSKEEIYWDKDLHLGDKNAKGEQLRPAIVWFGEQVPKIDEAVLEIAQCDILIIIGTSLQVYPAAGLVGVAKKAKQIFYVDPNPASSYETKALQNLTVIPKPATTGILDVLDMIEK
ncbi:MAG TPA: Sir2 family NAD-dependent protein deacetylase [Saprospiraceae bacterium]|nr:Sir2 family NAD-dependent protein deacetylase [Saprospiraceae bacterium]